MQSTSPNQPAKHDKSKKFIRDTEVAERYGIGRSTVWQWVQDGILPSPIRFGHRCSRWDSDELDANDKNAKSTT